MTFSAQRWTRVGAVVLVPMMVAAMSTVLAPRASASARPLLLGRATATAPSPMARLNSHSLLRNNLGHATDSGVESYISRLAAVSSNDVWAVGWYRPTKDPSITKPLAEHWNGTRWKRIPSPMPAGSGFAEFTNIDALSATDIWAVGYYSLDTSALTLLDHWNGKRWTQVTVTPPEGATRSFPLAVDALNDNDIWLVGYYSIDGSTNQTYTEHWDGATWTPVASQSPDGSPDAELEDVTVVSPNDVWAVGFAYSSDFSTLTTLSEHWDGSQWTSVKVPVHSQQSELISVTSLSTDDIWATGTAASATAYRTFVEHWDGSAWKRVPAPSPKTATLSGLTDVTAISADDIWGVGLTGQIFGDSTTLIEHWNGEKWARVKSPNPPGYEIAAMQGVAAVSGTDIWAGGVSTNGDVFHPLFEHWDGHAWVIPQ